MAGLRACAPAKIKGGGHPYGRPRQPSKLRELGESDDELDMDPRGGKSAMDKNSDVVPMPPNQSRLPATKALPPMVLPDDHILSPTFPRPGETIGRKKGKQLTSKCKCCERELTKQDRDKSLLSKYVKCTTCKGNVCELCRDRENRCHECYVQKSVSLDPNSLMEFQRETLLRFLEILHYNETDFEDFDKAHLVKQLLTRFREHEMWDPRFHADPEEIEELARKKEAKMALEEAENKEYSRQEIEYQKPRRTKSSDNILDESSHGQHRPSPGYATVDAGIRPGTPKKYPDMAQQGRKESPYKVPVHLLLQNITSPKQLEDLEVQELRAILTQYGVDPNGERPALKYRVLQLWNNLADKGQSERNTPSPNFASYPRADNLPRTFSLKDIPSTSAIEKLTITQMKKLLQKHGQDPEQYPHRSELEFQVQLLWNQAKREALGIQKEKQMPGLKPVRDWKSQENIQSPSSKWVSAAQVVQPPRDGGRYGHGNWGDVKRYQQQSPENVRRPEQYNPYQDAVHQPSTLPRNPPARYSPDPLPIPQKKRPTPPEPPPLPPPAPHLLKSLSLRDISKPEEISALSMKQMIGLLDDYSVNTDGASDKAHLEDLVRQLWFDKVMPARRLDGPQRVQGGAYHYPQNSPPSSYPTNTGFERQFSAMSVSSQQKYSDGNSYNVMTQQHALGHEATGPSYKPYGAILPQERGPATGGAVKKISQEMCTVCLVRQIDCIILNCGHMVSCMVCVSRMDGCPLCHSEIVKLINIK